MKLIIGTCLVLAVVAGAAVLNFGEDEFNQSNYPHGRITNGYTAQKGKAPYIVLFDNGTQYCAGSIIHPNWVLTAAHCFPITSFDVVAGLHSRYEKSKAQIRKANITNFIGHKKYYGGVGPNDIALVYVTPGFVLDPTGEPPVDKISLPSGKYNETGEGKVYGWGRLLNESFPMELQAADVNIIGYEECYEHFESPFWENPMDVCHICTYTEDVITNTYRNDSGGPLVTYTPDGPELVGIVSWGAPPSLRMPSVYTMVSAFKTWISEAITNFTLPETLPSDKEVHRI